MYKKITVIIFAILTTYLLACSDTTGVKYNQDDTTEYPADDPAVDEPLQDIKLQSLAISHGILIPVFKPDTFSYETSLTPEISELIITAQPPRDCFAEINGIPVTDNNCSVIIPVSGRITEISIPTGDSTREGFIYYLRITRLEEMIIYNSSFEIFDEKKYPSGWEMSGSGECRSSDIFFKSGNHSAVFTTLTGTISGREVLSPPVGIEQGKRIIASSWFYVPVIEGSSIERISISLKLYYFTDAECRYPASTEYATMTKKFLKEQGIWEKIGYEREADDIPAETCFVRIGVRTCYNSISGGTKYDQVYFDDISLQQ